MPATGPDEFQERFAIAGFAEGGVALDLETGSFYRLNTTALLICRALEEGKSRAAVEAMLTDTFAIAPEAAARSVADLLEGLAASAPRQDPSGPFRYLARGSEYVLARGDEVLLAAAADGRSLVRARSLPFPGLEECVKAMLPKILFLQGLRVLHGAACAVQGAVVAFCGVSGAGKTTTARTFAATGVELVAEDTIVLDRDDGPDLRVRVRTEPALRAWVAEAANALAQADHIDCPDLAALVSGPAVPLRRVIFLDRGRRVAPAVIRTTPLDPADALGHFLTSNFLGSAERSSWRRYLADNAALARTTRAELAWVPDGLAGLREAVRDYRLSSAG